MSAARFLKALRDAGLKNDQIALALARASSRKAPSGQRVQDWLSGFRGAPQWVGLAAASALCEAWEAERRVVPDAQLARCDAKWAERIDPVLGELHRSMMNLPGDVRAHLRPLEAKVRQEVSQRLRVELPGV